jgi:hypothetical protein
MRRLPLLPVWEKGVGGMRGKRAPQRSGRHRGTTAFLALLLRLQASRRVRAGGARTQGISASSGRFFGRPLRAISGFRQQNAQTPPSPRVGSRTDRKYVRYTFRAASERRSGQVWNPPLPMRRVEADGMADCALQCWKTCLCSNVLSALEPVWEKGVGGMRGPKRTGKLTYPFTAPPAAGTPVAVTAASAVWWV